MSPRVDVPTISVIDRLFARKTANRTTEVMNKSLRAPHHLNLGEQNPEPAFRKLIVVKQLSLLDACCLTPHKMKSVAQNNTKSRESALRVCKTAQESEGFYAERQSDPGVVFHLLMNLINQTDSSLRDHSSHDRLTGDTFTLLDPHRCIRFPCM